MSAENATARLTLLAREQLEAGKSFLDALPMLLALEASLGAEAGLALDQLKRCYRAEQMREWTETIVPPWATTNGRGRLEPTVANLIGLLRSDQRCAGTVRWNRLTRRLEVGALSPPWQPAAPEGTPLDEIAGDEFRAWLCTPKRCGFTMKEPSKQNAEAALSLIGKRDGGYHPVHDYLTKLPPHDGKERVAEMLSRVCRAEHSRYLEAMSWSLLLAMLERTYQPGCRYDHLLVLVGKPGIGKSFFLQALAAPWSRSVHFDFQSKDAEQSMDGLWVVVFDELSAVKKAERERVKSFLSTSVDHYRRSYGHQTGDEPRESVPCATTNEEECVDDPEDRRSHPVQCKGPMETDWFLANRGQIMAEALAAYREGVRWVQWLPALREEQPVALAAHTFVDENQQRIREWLRQRLEQYPRPTEWVTLDEIHRVCMEEMGRPDKATQLRYGRFLRQMGCEHRDIYDKHDGRVLKRWRLKTSETEESTEPQIRFDPILADEIPDA